MRRILIISIFAMSLNASGSLEVLSIEDIDSPELQDNVIVDSEESKKIKYREIKIKDNGVEQVILIELKDANNSIGIDSDANNKLYSKDGVIIDFSNLSIDIEEFEKLFHLKLKEKLQIGYYIFENQSDLSDIILIETILNSNMKESIKTIRANWEMGVETF